MSTQITAAERMRRCRERRADRSGLVNFYLPVGRIALLSNLGWLADPDWPNTQAIREVFDPFVNGAARAGVSPGGKSGGDT